MRPPRDPFEDAGLARQLVARIGQACDPSRAYVFMEVCGTHTQAIGRWGLRGLLPENLRLVSGPGCPVCVTPGTYIDHAARLALEHDAIVVSFGDLIRVPGRKTSLEEARSQGGDIRTAYSPADALTIAKSTDREVVFLAVGFETTIAANAGAMKAAIGEGLKNLSFYNSLRLVPPALDALIADPEIRLDGFLLPGHVSSVIGEIAYENLPRAGAPGVIAGFTPVEILDAVNRLVDLTNADHADVVNAYGRAVPRNGNPVAARLFEELFEVGDIVWRGLGAIPGSGYGLRDAYASFDAAKRFDLGPDEADLPAGCSCGDVLKGRILPPDCPLFAKACHPDHPVGPCMVSGEGSCAAFFKYGRD